MNPEQSPAPDSQQLLTQLTQLLAQATHNTTGPGAVAPPAPASFQTFASPPMMPASHLAASAAPRGLLVAVTIPLADGSEVSGYLQLGPEALGNPSAVIAGLASQGWPIRSFNRSQQARPWSQRPRRWS